MKNIGWIGLLVSLLALAACGPTATPTVPPSPTPPPGPPTAAPPPVAQEGIFLSEVLPGVHGVDNNLEFIELYNAGTEVVDLAGWSLWYRLDDKKEETLVYAWEERTDAPGHGHYLLVRAGAEVGSVGDAAFDTPLFEKRGGLALRDPEGATVDTLVWGEGPTGYASGSPAPAPEGGASLERLPGGEAGNGVHTGDHAADFVANPTPNPQNSGDPPTPLPAERLVVRLEAPDTIEPGAELAYTLVVENQTDGPVHGVRTLAPLPPQFEVLAAPEGGRQANGWLEWTLPELADGASAEGAFTLQGPWTYLSALVRGYYVEAEDWPQRAYGPLHPLTVAGGSIPIATARTLTGKTVTVEGTATMYTGGFYAGSTGVKFYLEDESGGIQVYCPGGLGIVETAVGDRVRVTGEIAVYRDSLEIIPAVYPDDVAMLERGGEAPTPAPLALSVAAHDKAWLGRLAAVEGTATRIEEFTYSYEVDLMDDEGAVLLVYIEKQAGVTTEPLDVGRRYRITGIVEHYSGQRQIKPRFQADLVEVFPPALMLELHAPNSVPPGGMITYTLTAYNHTDAPLTNLRLEAAPPTEGVSIAGVLDGGEQQGERLVWVMPELAGGGESATVRYLVRVDEEASGQIMDGGATARADQWPDPAATEPRLTFVGSGVPIWAIQGDGPTSPYVREQATTEGVVIGVFPDLHGFWIQETESDDDPATSAGLFVLMGELEIPVALGDRVRVHGKVRERSGQTLLDVSASEDVQALSSGQGLPPAVELDPPLEKEAATLYYEALEGMLVQVSAPARAVGPTSKYGETPLVRTPWGIERIRRGDPTGMLIFVDDGAAATHYDRTTLPFALQTGDAAGGVLGPLAFTYENYKIEPIAAPVITPTERPLPALEEAGADEFRVATFNVENMFDTYDPHPSDPPIPTTPQYKRDLLKTADAIRRMGAPTIVGLQEVENVEILADLAQEPAIARYSYEPVLIEGNDSRGIDVGYLVRSDRATLVGAAAYPAPEGLTSRPPLLITVTLHLASGEATVYVLNNHFSSMAGGEKPTEPRRKAQAAWNVTLVERILARDPEAWVIVLGDLNSFYDSPPLDVLRAAGLRHVYEFVESDRPYTYIYQGVSETLDHILATPSLYGRLVGVEALHINADYPPPDPDDPTAQRMSDHDPLLAVFALQ